MTQHTTTDPGFLGLSHGEQLMALGVFLLPALALIAPSGYSYGPIFILIGAVTMLAAQRCLVSRHAPLPTAVKAVVLVLAVYALFWMGDAALRGEGLREFDRPSRFLLAALCLVALARARVRPAWFWMGLAVGSIGAGGLAIWQKAIERVMRASGFAQTIQFGNAAMLMGLMCLAGLIWAWQPSRPRGQRLLLGGLLLLGGVAGMTASFLSGTRGAWLALVPALFIGLWAAKRLGRARLYLLVAPVLLATIAAGAYLHPGSQVAYRVDAAISDVSQYWDGSHQVSNVGKRLDMWKGAWHLFREKPLLGWGENGYIASSEALGQSGFISMDAAVYTHAHNEWLNTLAKKGLIGGVIFAGLYLAPLAGFVRAGRRAGDDRGRDRSRLALATAGVLFTLGFMATGMTQVNFNHNIGAMIYAFVTAVLVGLCYGEGPAKVAS